MKDFPKRGDVYWVSLDPAIGSETQKTRPCIIISNNVQNKNSSRVVIAPVTSNIEVIYPSEAKINVNGRDGKAMLDQIKTIDKQRLGKRMAHLDILAMVDVDKALKIALALV